MVAFRRRRKTISEHLIRLDDAVLAAALAHAGTDDVDEAVNLALRAYALRTTGGDVDPGTRPTVNPVVSDGLELLQSGALEDALDPEVIRSAWR